MSFDHLKTVLGSIFGFGICVGLLALLGDQLFVPPPNAKMIVDSEKLTFASVPCVVLGLVEREQIANREDARNPGAPLRLKPYSEELPMWMINDLRQVTGDRWRRDEKCNTANGFDQRQSVWGRLLGTESRWTNDGEWRF